MIRVESGSRLHFGLVRPVWGDNERAFGGCGLMIADPKTIVAVEPSSRWDAAGPESERALAVAQRLAASLQLPPHRIVIESCPPLHRGLGVGTQLAMCLGRALADSAGRSDLNAIELAQAAGRGQRSAIGIHGFELGGFIVDGGKCHANQIGPVVARASIPAEWRILLVVPRTTDLWHGQREADAFAALTTRADDQLLCRLILLGMLPALAERDLPRFGAAVAEFNEIAGRPFRDAQFGTNHPATREILAWLRREKVPGIGQSSWGPAVFAFVGDDEQAASLQRSVERIWGQSADIQIAEPLNHGAKWKAGSLE